MQLKRSTKRIAQDAPIGVLYQRHAPSILTYIRRHISSPEDAEDLLVEVFLAALEHNNLLCLNEGEQLAWLRRVAHNKLIDSYRRAKNRPVVTLDEVTDTLYEDVEQTPERVALRREEHNLLRSHLTHLSELQQEVLRLRFAVGLRSTEIAALLNKNEGAVRMLLSRSLDLLRNIYDNHHGREER